MPAILAEKSLLSLGNEVVVDLTDYEPFAGRNRFTRTSCDFLERVGEMPPRYELLDGEIISKMGQNRPHIVICMSITFWLSDAFGRDRVQSQADIEVAEPDRSLNRPQPDAAVLAKPIRQYKSAPVGSEVLLVVEISDTSLRDDVTRKAALYARAGIPEYWVMDVNSRRIVSHQDPAESGYATIAAYGEDDTIAPLHAPAAIIRVGDLFPH